MLEVCVVLIYDPPQGRQRVLCLSGPGRYTDACDGADIAAAEGFGSGFGAGFFFFFGVGGMGLRRLRRG